MQADDEYKTKQKQSRILPDALGSYDCCCLRRCCLALFTMAIYRDSIRVERRLHFECGCTWNIIRLSREFYRPHQNKRRCSSLHAPHYMHWCTTHEHTTAEWRRKFTNERKLTNETIKHMVHMVWFAHSALVYSLYSHLHYDMNNCNCIGGCSAYAWLQLIQAVIDQPALSLLSSKVIRPSRRKKQQTNKVNAKIRNMWFFLTFALFAIRSSVLPNDIRKSDFPQSQIDQPQCAAMSKKDLAKAYK